MPQTTDQLKPCPFCGGEPYENAIKPHSHGLVFQGMKMPDHAGSHVIECACGAGLIDETREAVLARWNARAVPLVAEAPREPTRDEYHAANRCLDAAALHLTGTTQWPANWRALREQFVGFIRAAKVAAPPVSVAPQPEQPNTEQPHLADNGRKPVQGLDAAAPSYYCNKCGSFPDAVQHKRPDGTDCPYIARTAHGVNTSCEWTEEDPWGNEPGTYDSACGERWSFIDGGPKENNVRFCQGCGKPVKLVPFPEPVDEDAAPGVAGSDALDAQRYRFLRDVARQDSNGGLRCVGNCADGGAPLHISGRDLDRAVDAASGVRVPDEPQKEKAMTEAAKPVAWIDETGQIYHSPRHHFLGLWNDTCGSAEALWSGCSLDEAVAKWKDMISSGEREVDLTGFGCGIIADHRDLERRYGKPKGTFMCWVCGRDTPHQHTPEEIERGREDDRWASEQDEKRWAETLTRIASLEARYPPRTPLYAHPPTSGVQEVPRG